MLYEGLFPARLLACFSSLQFSPWEGTLLWRVAHIALVGWLPHPVVNIPHVRSFIRCLFKDKNLFPFVRFLEKGDIFWSEEDNVGFSSAAAVSLPRITRPITPFLLLLFLAFFLSWLTHFAPESLLLVFVRRQATFMRPLRGSLGRVTDDDDNDTSNFFPFYSDKCYPGISFLSHFTTNLAP